jgi:hypothetical protein
MTRIRSFNHQAAVSFAPGEALLDPNAERLEGLHTQARSRAALPFAQQTKRSFQSRPQGGFPVTPSHQEREQ